MFKIKTTAGGVTAAIFIILSLVALFSDKIFASLPMSKYFIISALTFIFFFFPAMILKKSSGRKMSVFKKGLKGKWLPAVLCIALAVSFGCMLINAAVYAVLYKMPSLSAPVNPIAEISWDNPFAAVLAAVIVPAIFEEIYFRGAYLSWFSPEISMQAIFAGALCFAFFHGGPHNFLGPLAAGFAYGYMTAVFKSVWPAIIAHLINNTLVSIASWYTSGIEKAGLAVPALITIIIAFLVFLYLSFMFFEPFVHKIKGKPKLSLTQRRQLSAQSQKVFSFSFYLLIGIWILKWILSLKGVWY